ncbi:MAG: YggT family protein [Clostridia bacterium]|nr:YggT family protein [Clostridia bacterium]
MPEPIYVLVVFVLRFLDVLSLAMLLRAILGWFFVDGEGKLMRFLYTLTEPVVLPFRKLFHKLNWFQDMPIDMAFTFSWLFLYAVELVISLMY